MAAVNLVIQAAEAPGPDRGNICFHFRDLRSQNLKKIANFVPL